MQLAATSTVESLHQLDTNLVAPVHRCCRETVTNTARTWCQQSHVMCEMNTGAATSTTAVSMSSVTAEPARWRGVEPPRIYRHVSRGAVLLACSVRRAARLRRSTPWPHQPVVAWVLVASSPTRFLIHTVFQTPPQTR
jgi:hypothetical protein